MSTGPMDDLHARVDQAADEFLARLQAGEEPSVAAYLQAHVDIAGPLGRRLRLFTALHGLKKDDGERPPRTLGKFRVLGILGRGTFGTVYRGLDPDLSREVALKVPRSGFQDFGERERFLREARSAARLNHPGIVPIYEIAIQDGSPFIVSKVIEGKSLADVIKTGPREPREAALLASRIAEALDHAHAQGVIHRDIKPANILVDRSGDPHISDFGLARQAEEQVTVTLEGQLIGTPAYMSPEQAAGRHDAVDRRSDIYSLGVVLYEMITGERPFRGSTTRLIQQVILDEPRPPRHFNQQVPRDLETVCLKAMAKEPARRYSTAMELSQDLRRFLDGQPVKARPVSVPGRVWRWTKRKPVVAGLTAAVALLVATVVVVSSVSAYRTSLARDEANQRLLRLNVKTGGQRMDEGDPLGSLSWFAEALRLDPTNPRRAQAHRMRLASVLDHSPRLVQAWFPDGVASQIEFDVTGRYLLSVAGDRVRVWDCETGESLCSFVEEKGVNQAVFSPDGRRILLTSGSNTASVWSWAAPRPSASILLHHPSRVLYAAFSPDGRRILTSSEYGKIQVWDASTGEQLGNTLRHTQQVSTAAFNPTGTLVAVGHLEGDVLVWDAETGNRRIGPLKHAKTVSQVAFTSDGKRLLTASHDQTAQFWDVTTGERLGQPLEHAYRVQGAVLSPDGSRVITLCQGNTVHLWDTVTGEPVSGVIQLPAPVFRASFRSDGRAFITLGKDGTPRTWDAATGEEIPGARVPSENVVAMAIHDGGRRVAATTVEGVLKVWDTVRGEPSFPALRHDGPVHWSAFSPDGSRIVTASDDSTARFWDARTGAPLPLTLRHAGPVKQAALSPDGARIVTLSGRFAQVWDSTNGKPVAPPATHTQTINCVAFSPDSTLLVTASETGNAQIWSVATGEELGGVFPHWSTITSAGFTAQGRHVLSGDMRGTIRIWEQDNPQPIFWCSIESSVYFTAISRDEFRLLAAYADGSARLWERTTRRIIAKSLPHSQELTQARFSPDEKRFLTASRDGTARIWDAANGLPLTEQLQHASAIYHAEFSSNGLLVATASHDGSARVWDAETGEPVTPPLRHGARVSHAVFSPDASVLVTSSHDGAARIWRLRSPQEPLEDLELLSRVLSGRKTNRQGGVELLSKAELREAWDVLRLKYPRELTTSIEDVLAWHGRETQACMARGH